MIWIEAGLGHGIGLIVGFAYFAGLRWTVDRVANTTRPVQFLAGSFAVRSLFVIVAAALVMLWSLPAFWASALGFALARWLIVGRVRRSLAWN